MMKRLLVVTLGALFVSPVVASTDVPTEVAEKSVTSRLAPVALVAAIVGGAYLADSRYNAQKGATALKQIMQRVSQSQAYKNVSARLQAGTTYVGSSAYSLSGRAYSAAAQMAARAWSNVPTLRQSAVAAQAAVEKTGWRTWFSRA